MIRSGASVIAGQLRAHSIASPRVRHRVLESHVRSQFGRARLGSCSGHSIASTPSSAHLVQPEIVDLARIVQAIQVDVKRAAAARRDTPASSVNVGLLTSSRIDAEAFGQPADERRLPRPEIAEQQHDDPARERARELASDRGGFGFGIVSMTGHESASARCCARRPSGAAVSSSIASPRWPARSADVIATSPSSASARSPASPCR